jgi:hypothetical protein
MYSALNHWLYLFDNNLIRNTKLFYFKATYYNAAGLMVKDASQFKLLLPPLLNDVRLGMVDS